MLGAQLFDRVGKKLVINENGRALLPRAGILEQAVETEALFTAAHAASLRLAASYTIGEYLLPVLIARWKQANPRSHVLLDIANTHDVFERVASFRSDIGFIRGPTATRSSRSASGAAMRSSWSPPLATRWRNAAPAHAS